MMNNSVFTTIKIKPKPEFLKEHYQRLMCGCASFNFKLKISEANFIKEVKKISQTACENQALKVIVNQDEINYVLRPANPANNYYHLKVGQLMTEYPVLVNNLPQKLKLHPNHEQINALKQIKSEMYDDCVLVDENGFILETLIANIFILKNNILYTPSINKNILSGIIRQKIIDNFYVVKTNNLQVQDLMTSDCVFITNCLRKIQVVTSINNIMLENDIQTEAFIKKLTYKLEEFED